MSSTPVNLTGLDADLDVRPEIVNAAASASSESVLKFLLGVNTGRDLGNDAERSQFSTEVAGRLFDTVASVRSGLNRAGFTNELDQNVQRAIDRVKGKKTMDRPEQYAAALDAIYKVAGIQAMNKLLANSLSPYENAMAGEAPNTISADRSINGATARVTIDLSNNFWKTNSVADTAALEAVLDGKILKDIGIKVAGQTDNYKLTTADAKEIATASWGVIKLDRSLGQEVGNDAGIQWTLDLDSFIRQEIVIGGVPRLVASMNIGMLAGELANQNTWNRFFPTLASINSATTPYPSLFGPPPPSISGNYALYMAHRIFARAAAPITGPLGGASENLFAIKNETVRRADFYSRLSEGSQNVMGASIAMAMVAERPSLLSTVGANNKAQLEAEKKKLEGSKSISAITEKGKALSLGNFEYDHASVNTYDDYVSEYAKMRNDRDRAYDPSYTTWASQHGMTFAPPATVRTDANRVDAFVKSMSSTMTDAQKDIKRFEKISNMLIELKDALMKAGAGLGTKINGYFVSAASLVIDRSKLDKTMTAEKIFDEIMTDLSLDSVADIETKIKEKDEAIKVASSQKDLKGDELQNAVFTQYMKDKGITNPEGVANFAQTDAALGSVVDEAVDNMLEQRYPDAWYESDRNPANWYNHKIVTEIFTQAGVPMRPRRNWLRRRFRGGSEGFDPEWGEASFESLCTSYFALKQLVEGKDNEVSMSGTPYAKDQLKTIARILSTKYGNQVYNQMFTNLSEEERKKANVKSKQSVTTQVVLNLLKGDTPSAYKEKVSAVITGAKTTVNGRRYLRNGAGNLLWRNSGYSLRSLVSGNDYLSARGAANGVYNVGAYTINNKLTRGAGTVAAYPFKKTGEALSYGWRNKAKVALLGGTALIAGLATGGIGAPLLFAAGYKAFSSTNTPEAAPKA